MHYTNKLPKSTRFLPCYLSLGAFPVRVTAARRADWSLVSKYTGSQTCPVGRRSGRGAQGIGAAPWCPPVGPPAGKDPHPGWTVLHSGLWRGSMGLKIHTELNKSVESGPPGDVTCPRQFGISNLNTLEESNQSPCILSRKYAIARGFVHTVCYVTQALVLKYWRLQFMSAKMIAQYLIFVIVMW